MTKPSTPDPAPADTSGSVVSVARADAPRGLGLVEGLKAAGITRLGRETIDFPALEFGARLREMRVRRGWTQAQLAAVVGCAQGDLSDIERGKGKDGPTYRVLREFAVALGEALPINPTPPVASIEVSDENRVIQSHADFRTYEPLLTLAKRAGLVRYVARRVAGANLVSNACALINVAANSKAWLTPNIEPLVLTKLSGAGRIQVHNPLHRNAGSDDGDPIAILGPGSRVQITTPDGGNLIVMVAAAGGVLAAGRGARDSG